MTRTRPPGYLRDVPAAFGVGGAVGELERLAGGHIHGTWLVRAGGDRYVAQAVNRSVFTDLDACETNLSRLDDHLRGHPIVTIASMHRTVAGAVHWIAPDGTAWRLADYLEGTVAGSSVADPAQAFDVASAFGRYVAALGSLPGPPLASTLGRFHDLAWRRDQLAAAMRADRCSRARACAATAGAIDAVAGRVGSELDGSTARCGPVPVRAVHNDAKVANVRFDAETGAVAAIVDLDTTMPGSVLSDLGELLRTATIAVPEDDAGGRSLSADRGRVVAVVQGFVGGVGELTVAERAAAPWAGAMLAIENAARFMADHLDGDRYFGAERPGHNLDRSRTQLAVAEALIDAVPTIAAALPTAP